MFSFEWPWAFALILLPLAVRYLTAPVPARAGAIRVPFFDKIRELQQMSGRLSLRHRWLVVLLALLGWLALVIACARPMWIGDAVSLPVTGRDLLLAVDISGSMREDDMKTKSGYATRIDAVKDVVGEFVQRRTGDRLGLILFGEQGYLQTPLTFDRNTVHLQLNEAIPGFAGNATAIGDAIGLAIHTLRDRPAESRVVILLTDGANTTGTNPRDAAKVAAEAKIRIHTVGVGADTKLSRTLFGMTRTQPSRDLDEPTLEFIASETGGTYFRARDPVKMREIYATLDTLEPVPESRVYRPRKNLFHWPLTLALALWLGLLVHRHLSWRATPQ